VEHVYTAHFLLLFVACTLDILQLEQSCLQMNFGNTVWVWLIHSNFSFLHTLLQEFYSFLMVIKQLHLLHMPTSNVKCLPQDPLSIFISLLLLLVCPFHITKWCAVFKPWSLLDYFLAHGWNHHMCHSCCFHLFS